MRNFGFQALLFCSLMLIPACNAFSLSNFTNYQNVIKINDIVASGNKIWAASSGGLLLIDPKKNSQAFYSDIYSFPDVNLTALSMDSKGNLWIGSSLGYIYKRTPAGEFTSYDSYYGVGWGILDIYAYKDYIIVGSTKGCSIFDPQKGTAIRNATAMDTTGDPSVNVIAVHNDSLYVGCNRSYDAFDISGNNFLDGNYLDISLWNPVYTGSAIVSFVDSSGSFMARSGPSLSTGKTLFRCANSADSSSFITADSSTVKIEGTAYVYAGDTVAFNVPGAVTRMSGDTEGNLWLGTDKNFLYCWNGKSASQYKISGPTFNYFNRVYAARNGTVWMTTLASGNPPWYEGIMSFDGKQWGLYNRFSTKLINTFSGGSSDFRGICEDNSGNMWFGTSGSEIYKYYTSQNIWSSYFVSGYVFDSIREYSYYPNYWGIHDAIAQDSSGYMWFSNYQNNTITTGPLVCYNAALSQTPSYRRFFPQGTDYYVQNISSICVDSRGYILAGNNDGRLLILKHNGNPIKEGVQVVLNQSNLSSIPGMYATSGGITWIATGSGLYKYNSVKDSLTADTVVKSAISCIAAETDLILWLGTSGSGLIRYDVAKDSTKTIDMTTGLVSNSVTDLSIDRNNGYLWIGTSAGLSRYSLGHTNVAVSDNASIVAYPNPFSRSNPSHREIVFKHCAAGAKVLVYAINGSLIKQLSSDTDNAYQSQDNSLETTLRWIPSARLAPGTYYYVGQSQKPAKAKKLLIVP
jgi:streptogramin lyase